MPGLICYRKALDFEPLSSKVPGSISVSSEEEQSGGIPYSVKDCYMRALELDSKYAMAWIHLGRVGGGTVQGLHYPAEDCRMKPLSRKSVARINVMYGLVK